MSSERESKTIEDVDAPGLGLDMPERIDLDDLSNGGLAISVELGLPAELQLALRSFGIEPLVAGARGSTDRPRLTTLATASASAPGGRSEHRLSLDRNALARVEQAPASREGVRARVVVQARTEDGRSLVSNRRLLITPVG